MNYVKYVIIIVTVFFVNGCSNGNKELKLGIIPWIGYETIYQAKEFKWLDEKIKFVEGKILSDSFKRIISGEVDAATMPISDVLLARSKGVELTIVAVLDVSSGADVILSKTKFTDLKEMKGKRIAFEKSVLGSLLYTKLLQKAGLEGSDLLYFDISPQDQFMAWKQNKIDIAISYEPFASILIENNANYLLSTHDMPEMIFDVLVVRNDRISGRENTVQNLVNGHFKALEYLHTNYTDILYRISSRENIPPSDVKRSLRGVIFPSKVANKQYLRAGSKLMQSMKELSMEMSEKGFTSDKVSVDDFFNAEYVKD